MTPRQIQLVRDTFPSLIEMPGAAAQLFYGRLFQQNPGLRPMFRGDIRVQGVKLMDMLQSMVENLESFDSRIPALQALGQRHAGYGVKPEHYAMVLDSFLWMMAKALDREFTPEVRAAWTELMTKVAGAMTSQLPEE